MSPYKERFVPLEAVPAGVAEVLYEALRTSTPIEVCTRAGRSFSGSVQGNVEAWQGNPGKYPTVVLIVRGALQTYLRIDAIESVTLDTREAA